MDAGWEPALALLAALGAALGVVLLSKEAPRVLGGLFVALVVAALFRARTTARSGGEDDGLRDETLLPRPRPGREDGERQAPTGAGAPTGTRSGSADQTTR